MHNNNCIKYFYLKQNKIYYILMFSLNNIFIYTCNFNKLMAYALFFKCKYTYIYNVQYIHKKIK